VRHIDRCPVCGSLPFYTIKKRVDLNKVNGILREQYIEYNIKLCGEDAPNERFAICGVCAAIYRAFHFTDEEIRTIYTSLYLNFEEKFPKLIIYNDKKLMDGCSSRMYEKVRAIEKVYNTSIVDVFDIGGRDGFRLAKLADDDYSCTVYDPILQKPCNEKIYKRNIWSNELREDEKADLIVMCNVLEHSMNPRALVDDCYTHLNKNGFLFLEIPVDFNTFFDWLLCYQLFKKSLSIDLTHHVFFSKRTIATLLEEKSFIVKKINYNRLPVCGVKVMEVLAQKDSEKKTKSKATARETGSSILFFVVSLSKVFPRVVLNTLERSYLKFIRLLSGYLHWNL
jgi:hypothetical protein